MMATIAALLASSSMLFAHDTPVDAFADCAGRYSAEMEHAWLMGTDGADVMQERRASFVALLDASMPAQAGRIILNRRIEAKFAHAALLQLADLGPDPQRARHARMAANMHLTTCSRMLLGS